MQTTESPTLEGLPLVLPPHLTANFDKADSLIKESRRAGLGALVGRVRHVRAHPA